MELSHDFGVWIGAILTLGIWSFLYKDNPLYKFTEALFVGVSAGYLFTMEIWNVIVPKLVTNLQEGRWIYLIPALLGLSMLLRLFKGVGWVSRYAISFVIGTYSGIFFISFMKENLLHQIAATIVPLVVFSGEGAARRFDLWASLNNVVIVAGVLSALTYFFFSREHKGATGCVARVGVWFLMVSFGAAFGYTVMARVSLLVGRLDFMLGDWLGLLN
ncbi:MAG: hypothetical protein C4523_09885 [Myxococcales bacterium]|nr:MAG: hypothetical protein C4523_09885 [Myxococcales bacterium]